MSRKDRNNEEGMSGYVTPRNVATGIDLAAGVTGTKTGLMLRSTAAVLNSGEDQRHITEQLQYLADQSEMDFDGFLANSAMANDCHKASKNLTEKGIANAVI